jgi:hypothetical protein
MSTGTAPDLETAVAEVFCEEVSGAAQQVGIMALTVGEALRSPEPGNLRRAAKGMLALRELGRDLYRDLLPWRGLALTNPPGVYVRSSWPAMTVLRELIRWTDSELDGVAESDNSHAVPLAEAIRDLCDAVDEANRKGDDR